MKVALISYGPADYSVSLANGLARECDVMLMLPRGEAMEHQASLASTVQFYSFDKPRVRQPIRQLQSIRQLLKKIRSFRPDVIHYQHCHMWFNLALPLLRSYPVVITIHDPRHHAGDLESRRTPQWLMDFGYRRASRVIVLGEALKQQVSALFDIAAVKVHVIPHVAIGSETAPLATKDDGRIILFFGRIWDYKGLKYLIEAEPLISRAIPDVRIVIAGEGE